MSVSPTALAGTVSCEQVIQACDAALDAKNREIGLKDLAIQQRQDQIVELNSELQDANSKLQSPVRNPFIMTTVGVLIGILVTGIALK